MAKLENLGGNAASIEAHFRGLSDAQLIAQELVQQGAVHAVSYLLSHGCSESAAVEMMASLRKNAQRIREEAARRGKPSIFDNDQTAFS